MSRYISFVMLLGTIVVCGFYFYNVIKGFILPLFLAALMAVIFRPVHDWFAARFNGKPTLAAATATFTIMSIVTLPLAGLIALGFNEAKDVVRNQEKYLAKIRDVRLSVGLQKPFASRLDEIETELRHLDEIFLETENADATYSIEIAQEKIGRQIEALKIDAVDACERLGNSEDEKIEPFIRIQAETLAELLSRDLEDEVATHKSALKKAGFDFRAADDDMLSEQRSLKYVLSQSDDGGGTDWFSFFGQPEAPPNSDDTTEASEAAESESAEPPEPNETTESQEPTEQVGAGTSLDADNTASQRFLDLLNFFETKLASIPTRDDADPRRPVSIIEQRERFKETQIAYDGLQTDLLGGPIWKLGIELLNPSDAILRESVSKSFLGGATQWLPSITNTATSLISGLLMGLAIISISLFYFFMDGARMVAGFMRLSPLDDRHEMELLQEFDKVSRAVVLATLLSALAQGVLGGIGYHFAGVGSVFLLTLLTAVLALIPFVGAAAVWFPVCIYIAFVQETPEPTRTWMYIKAGGLFAYGFLVVSMADNIIKPWVLQGQSKLHPLFALLSVLGGVQALGPIGILVGPMVVAFLQVLLTILQREIISLDREIQGTA